MQDPTFRRDFAEEALIQIIQEAFAEFLVQHKIDHEDLAQRLGWTLGRVKRFFRNAPTLREIVRMANVLGLDVSFTVHSRKKDPQNGT
jgi:hypothetical protein